MTNNLKSLEAQAEKVGQEHGVGKTPFLRTAQKNPGGDSNSAGGILARDNILRQFSNGYWIVGFFFLT